MDGPSLERKTKIMNCSKCAMYDLLEVSCDFNTYQGNQDFKRILEKDMYHRKYEEAEDFVGTPPHIPIGPPPGKHVGNGKPKGMFAFTITASDSDGKNKYDMMDAVRKIMKQKTCPVEKYIWYLEEKEDGRHPHIHGVYRTANNGQIHTKVFKRYWPIWDPEVKLGAGFRGGYHKPVDSELSYVEYIEKDEGIHESNWN